MPRLSLVTFNTLALAFLAHATTKAEEPPAETAVLTQASYWRCTYYWHPEVAGTQAEAKIVEGSKRHPFSLPPDSSWKNREFDDSGWWRGRGPFYGGYGFGQPTTLAAIYLRKTFQVARAADVKSLRLSARFRGGIVVYLNGKEVKRLFLPEGEIQPNCLADDYSADCYTHPDGETAIRGGWGEPEKFRDRCEMRMRQFKDIQLAEHLVDGANVLAIEIHRAATHPVWFGLKERWSGRWNTCGLHEISLVTTDAAVQPDVGRPTGFQLWNANPLATVFDVDYGDSTDPLRPISVIGTRNGEFSGQVVLGCDAPIKGVGAELRRLNHTERKGSIEGDRIQIRFARASGGEKGAPARYAGANVARFDILEEAPPAEVPVVRKSKSPGAVLPIWVTVHVPKDAAPGAYEGELVVRAEGLNPTRVPVQLLVCDWTLPNPADYRTHIGLVPSPDSVALQFGVRLWSDEHFAKMERSLRLLGKVGNKTVFIPLIAQTNFGNEESMLRWIADKNGGYTYDFSIIDRYMDLYEKCIGKPDVVCLYVWEPFTGGSYFGAGPGKSRPVQVSLLNRETGQVSLMESPIFGTPESETFWKPVFDELKARMQKRGLTDDNLMIGIAGDSRPPKQHTDFFNKVAPYATWVLHSHGLAGSIASAKVGYVSHVWGVKFANDPDEPDRYTGQGRWYGWKQDWRKTVFPREGAGAVSPPLHSDAPTGTYRMISEGMLVSGYRGFGRVGADFWPVLPSGRGERSSVIARYPQSGWSQLNLSTSTASVLYPGPDGAIASVRFQMIKEGVQEAEARIALEKALLGDLKAKMGAEKAKQIQDLLDLRTRCYRTACHTSWDWFAGSGWQERMKALYTLAGEVARLAKD